MMLPTEAFADVVAFLRVFDLRALVVTNSLCSLLAAKTSNLIRWEQFPGLLFHVENRRIEIYRRAGAPPDGALFQLSFMAQLKFTKENDMFQFVADSFPNCILGKLAIFGISSERLILT